MRSHFSPIRNMSQQLRKRQASAVLPSEEKESSQLLSTQSQALEEASELPHTQPMGETLNELFPKEDDQDEDIEIVRADGQTIPYQEPTMAVGGTEIEKQKVN